MTNKLKTNLMDGIAGNFKPLMILLVVLIYFGITINRYYEKYNKSYEQVSITKLTGLDEKKEFELSGFKIKETEIRGQEEGDVGLYVNDTDAKPRATIIVKDVAVFLKSFKTKNKINAKPFQGIHQGSPKFLKNYIINYGVEDENNELKTLLVHEEYFTWKSVFLELSLYLAVVLISANYAPFENKILLIQTTKLITNKYQYENNQNHFSRSGGSIYRRCIFLHE